MSPQSDKQRAWRLRLALGVVMERNAVKVLGERLDILDNESLQKSAGVGVVTSPDGKTSVGSGWGWEPAVS